MINSGSNRLRVNVRRFQTGDTMPTIQLTSGTNTKDYTYHIITLRDVLPVGEVTHDSGTEQDRGGAVQGRRGTATSAASVSASGFGTSITGYGHKGSIQFYIAGVYNGDGGSWASEGGDLTLLEEVTTSNLSTRIAYASIANVNQTLDSETFNATTSGDLLYQSIIAHPGETDELADHYGEGPDFIWRLDETSLESVSGALHGRPGPTARTGIIPGSSAKGWDNDTTEQLKIDDDEAINTGGAYSGQKRAVAFWLRVDVDRGTTGNGQAIYTQGGGTNGFSVYLYGGYIYVSCNEAGSARGYARYPYSIDTDYFVVCGFNVLELDRLNGSQDQSFFMYVNGELAEFGDAQFGTDLASHSGNIALGLPDSSTRNHLGNSITGTINGLIQGFQYFGDGTHVNGNKVWRMWRAVTTADQAIPYEVDGTSNYVANNTDLTLDMGTGNIEEGDFMCAWVWNVNSLNWDSAPAGWTAHTSNRTRNNVVGRMYTKVADASDVADPSVTFTVPANGNLMGRITAIRGTSGIDVQDFNAMVSNNYDSVTTTEDNCLVVCVCGWDQDESLSAYTPINFVGGVKNGSGSSAVAFYHGNFFQRTAGATGNKTGQSMVSFRDLVGGQIAFAPSSTPAPSTGYKRLINGSLLGSKLINGGLIH